MWIFNVDGFFSAVEDRKNPVYVIVRARYREDLEKIREKINLRFVVEDTPDADYPYRLGMSKSRWAEYVSKSAGGINYDNFKSVALKDVGSVRSAQYHGVWATMAGYNYYDEPDPVAVEAEKTFDEPLRTDKQVTYLVATLLARKAIADGEPVNAFQWSTMLAYIYGKTKEETLFDLTEK